MNHVCSIIPLRSETIQTMIAGEKPLAGHVYDALLEKGKKGDDILTKFKDLSEMIVNDCKKIGSLKDLHQWIKNANRFNLEILKAKRTLRTRGERSEEIAQRINNLRSLHKVFDAIYKKGINEYQFQNFKALIEHNLNSFIAKAKTEHNKFMVINDDSPEGLSFLKHGNTMLEKFGYESIIVTDKGNIFAVDIEKNWFKIHKNGRKTCIKKPLDSVTLSIIALENTVAMRKATFPNDPTLEIDWISLRKLNLKRLILENEEAWRSAAQSHKRGFCLINKHTRQGQHIIEQMGQESLEQSFFFQSIICLRNGQIYIRIKSQHLAEYGIETPPGKRSYFWAEYVNGNIQLLDQAKKQFLAADIETDYAELIAAIPFDWSDLHERIREHFVRLDEQGLYNRTLAIFYDALKGNFVEKFRNNRLTPQDIALLQACKRDPFFTEDEKAFFDFVAILYEETVTEEYLQHPLLHGKEMILKGLGKKRRIYKEWREQELVVLVKTKIGSWLRKAKLNHERYCVISQYTVEGKLLRENTQHTLVGEYGVSVIFVKNTGEVFCRRLTDRYRGSGSYKTVFEVQESQGKAFAWTLLKDAREMISYRRPAMQELGRIIETNPGAAFNKLDKFVRHGAKAFSIGELFDGSAESLREELGRPVFYSQNILKVTHALFLIHQAHIIHRDIKPANFLMMKDGHTVLSDYDLVGFSDDQDIGLKGTPCYLSLESIFAFFRIKITPDMLLAGDVFALARSLLVDLNPELESETQGFIPQQLFSYLKQIKEIVLDPNRFEISGRAKDRLLAAETEEALTDLFKRFPQKTIEEFVYAWIGDKRQEHNRFAPDGRKPYQEFRQLLWEGTSPWYKDRPTAAQFFERILVLEAANKLPVLEEPVHLARQQSAG